MAPSIRTYLLVNLLLSVTLITSLAIVGNLFLAHQDMREQLDEELIRYTVRMQAIFSGPLNAKNFSEIQTRINDEDEYLEAFRAGQQSEQAADADLQHLSNGSQNPSFQVWDTKGNLVLHSK